MWFVVRCDGMNSRPPSAKRRRGDGRSSRKRTFGCATAGNQLHFHAFAERQFAHADVELVADAEHFAHFGDGALKPVGRDA